MKSISYKSLINIQFQIILTIRYISMTYRGNSS